MSGDGLRVCDIWVSEHYWPDLSGELITAQAQRLARAGGPVATVVLPDEQTAFGLHQASGPKDVERALAWIGLTGASIGAGWLLTSHGLTVPSAEDGGRRDARPH